MPVSQPSLDLKNPGLAAFLAWLIPGLGHIYQGRILKGVLFSSRFAGCSSSAPGLGPGGSFTSVGTMTSGASRIWRSSPSEFPRSRRRLDALDLRPAFARVVPPLATYESKPLTQREIESLCERLSVPRGGVLGTNEGSAR